MTLKDLVYELKQMDSHEIFNFWAKDFDGSCPCFSGTKIVDGKEVHAHGRCWRVSESYGYQDLYIWGDLEKPQLKLIAREVKRALGETEWYSPYKIKYEEFL